ncbi:MAG TPA: hypothetical protein VJ844_06550 [Mucilaginibacter sp.]|nr:hypothetical protein [Mucilaginibacter sp.]
MRKNYILICLALLISLFIYLFYRTGRTVVNDIVIRMISLQTYTTLKAHIVRMIPLNDTVIYSLPEGLWVFCITLTSKPYYIRLNQWRFNYIFIPLIFCVMLELFQLFHITRGRFDFMDIGVSVVFWLLGSYVSRDGAEKKNMFTRPDFQLMVCWASYAIVYLSHVLK